MTREEAIANLNMISVAFVEPVTREQRKLIDDTFEMAIKALEQEPILDRLTEIIEPLRHLAFDEMSDVEWQILQVIDKYAEQEPCEDCISRKEAISVMCSNCPDWQTCKLNCCRRKALENKKKLPPVVQEPKTVALLEKTYDDFFKCEGGEGWMKIDGKEYSTDTGYALEGMKIFMEVFKRRLAESEPQERSDKE